LKVERSPRRLLNEKSTISVEAAVSAAILQYTHATRVPLQQDTQAARLPLQLWNNACEPLDITLRSEREEASDELS